MAKVAVENTTNVVKYLIGKVIPDFYTSAVKIQIPNFEYDERLHMHFRNLKYCYADDPEKVCKTGDLILIQELPEKMTRMITHRVVEVIFPTGNFTDPISGKKVVGNQYRDNIEKMNKFFGKSGVGFDFDKAPARGSLEDKRDFTHKPSYRKYYDDPNDPQPYASY